jgi:hypothetical protein
VAGYLISKLKAAQYLEWTGETNPAAKLLGAKLNSNCPHSPHKINTTYLTEGLRTSNGGSLIDD